LDRLCIFLPDVILDRIGEWTMTKQAYLAKLLELMTPAEIALSMSYPTKYMSKTHILLHAVALRRLGVKL